MYFCYMVTGGVSSCNVLILECVFFFSFGKLLEDLLENGL